MVFRKWFGRGREETGGVASSGGSEPPGKAKIREIKRISDPVELVKLHTAETDSEIRAVIRGKLAYALCREARNADVDRFRERFDLYDKSGCLSMVLTSVQHGEDANALLDALDEKRILRLADLADSELWTEAILKRSSGNPELCIELRRTAKFGARLGQTVESRGRHEGDDPDSVGAESVDDSDELPVPEECVRNLTPEAKKLLRNRERLRKREEICQRLEAFRDLVAETAEATLETVRNEWKGLPPVPPEYREILDKRFDTACRNWTLRASSLLEAAVRRAEATEELERICVEVESIGSESDAPAAERRLRVVEEAWNRVAAGAGATEGPLAHRFRGAVEIVENRLRAMAEESEAAYRSLREEIEALLSEAGNLVGPDSRPTTGAGARIREIRARWKETREVLAARDPAWAKTVSESLRKIDEELHRIFVESDLRRCENHALKEVLCRKAEELDSLENLYEANRALRALRSDWQAIGAVPREKAEEQWQRFDVACSRVHEKCREFFAAIETERQQNLEQKILLCEAVEAVMDSEQWKEASVAIKAAQAEWKSTGPVPKERDAEVWQRFRGACDRFFSRQGEFFAGIREREEESRKRKEEICERALPLAEETDWRKGHDFVRSLRDEWKQAGWAGRNVDDELWNRFSASVEGFYERMNAEQPANLEKKRQILRELTDAVAPSDETMNFRETAERVDAIRERWEQIGPVPESEHESLTGEFFTRIRDFQERRRRHFAEKDAERERNRLAKEALIEKVETIVGSDLGWNEAAEAIRGIQTEWKTIGHAPRECDDELWRQFGEVCNAFFENRRQFFGELRAEREENLRQKTAICIRLEQLAGAPAPVVDVDRMDPKSLQNELTLSILGNSFDASRTRRDATEEADRLCDDWRRIGSVPYRENEAINRRYRNACDALSSALRTERRS